MMAAVLAAFLMIGMALPVLPLHIQFDLGFGPFIVGLVAGSQFAASLLTRVWAGSFSDRTGPKQAVIAGLVAAAVSGALYLLSFAFAHGALISVAVLTLGRAVLGCAESLIMTGGVSWGLAIVDEDNAGKVIAWVGTAMLAALSLGAPVGGMLYDAGDFAAIGLATVLLPLGALILIVRIPSAAPSPTHSETGLLKVAGAVWLPGLGAAFSSVGYAAILAFGSLLFASHHWRPIWLAFAAFGFALILARVLLGRLPDAKGGARIALLFVLVEVAGLIVIWRAQNALIATVGAALAGFGYSLVYPGFGVEAVRGVARQNRGRAMGLYTAMLDVAMGLGSPALGFVAGQIEVDAVFGVSAAIVLVATAVAFRLQRRKQPFEI